MKLNLSTYLFIFVDRTALTNSARTFGFRVNKSIFISRTFSKTRREKYIAKNLNYVLAQTHMQHNTEEHISFKFDAILNA